MIQATHPVINPGAMLGVVGGGQLGRMFTSAAQRLGYRVAVWSDTPDAPALALADLPIAAPYTDHAALARFTAAVSAATVEFENLPAATLRAIEARVPLRPSAAVVEATQHRVREKEALRHLGVPLAPYAVVAKTDDAAAAAAALQEARAELLARLPGHAGDTVLKTGGFGYDGKGQVRWPAATRAPSAAVALVQSGVCVLEAWVAHALEVSVVAARAVDGAVAVYPVFENHHQHHILDTTLVPARLAAELAQQAQALARQVLVGLDVVGLVCVEFFVTAAGELWVNEVAPRPHNSGHITIEACVTDQFQQQVRALTGLPLGNTRVVAPGAMANLLGDAWAGGEPNWRAALAQPGVAVHLYGKTEARAGRKMGHLSVVADAADEALARVLEARARLQQR